MLQVRVNHNELEHPIPCSICSGNADVLFFERLNAKHGIALRKKDARCAEHLTA